MASNYLKWVVGTFLPLHTLTVQFNTIFHECIHPKTGKQYGILSINVNGPSVSCERFSQWVVCSVLSSRALQGETTRRHQSHSSTFVSEWVATQYRQCG